MFLGLKFMHQRNKSFERESSTPSGNGVAVKPAYEGKGNGSLSFPFFQDVSNVFYQNAEK
mgnify:CR=1 FL=1